MEKKHTTKDLEAAIEKMHIGGSIQFVECFHNFLDLALSYFCNNMNERQMALRKRVEENEDFRKAYQEALEAYGDCAEDYKDPMGDMFMEKISHGQHGQFFTPEDLCTLSAELIGIGNIEDGQTINDPTSGSGRMLLKALQIARAKGREPILYANDISMTCAKMCLLNFLVNSVDGEVTCGDALRLDWENFTFFKIDKVRNLSTGAVLSTYWQYTTADVEKVSDKRINWWLWIAEHGWMQYQHFSELKEEGEKKKEDGEKFVDMKFSYDPLQTEIKMGENGQFQLF